MTGPRLIGWRLSAPGRLIGRLAGSKGPGPRTVAVAKAGTADVERKPAEVAPPQERAAGRRRRRGRSDKANVMGHRALSHSNGDPS